MEKKEFSDTDSEFVKAVKCEQCGSLHDSADRSFVRIEGNIYIGMDGGIVGNNFSCSDETGKISVRSSFFCLACFEDLMDQIRCTIV